MTDLDTASLLAGAMLKLADSWDRKAAELDGMAERADARGADALRTTLMSARAQAHNDCAAVLRQAVEAALAGTATP